MSSLKGKTNYQRQLKGSKDGKPRNNISYRNGSSLYRDRTQQRLEGDEIDLKFGFERLKEVNSLHLFKLTSCFKWFN